MSLSLGSPVTYPTQQSECFFLCAPSGLEASSQQSIYPQASETNVFLSVLLQAGLHALVRAGSPDRRFLPPHHSAFLDTSLGHSQHRVQDTIIGYFLPHTRLVYDFYVSCVSLWLLPVSSIGWGWVVSMVSRDQPLYLVITGTQMLTTRMKKH